jgi:hypothetical protein
MAPYVERFVLEGQTARLSAAALETLAIVAYKQPISRAQIAAIRGVSVDGVIRTLEQRGYITEIARDPGPGNPSLFGTTHVFLEKLGLDTIDDLPPIAAFVPGPDVVEQLEQGLRAEIDPEVVAEVEAASDGDEGIPTEVVDDIDLVDGLPGASDELVLVDEEHETVEVDDDGDVIETTETDVVTMAEDGTITETDQTDVVVSAPDGSVVEIIETDVVSVGPDGVVAEVIETDVVAIDPDGTVSTAVQVDVVDDDGEQDADGPSTIERDEDEPSAGEQDAHEPDADEPDADGPDADGAPDD